MCTLSDYSIKTCLWQVSWRHKVEMACSNKPWLRECFQTSQTDHCLPDRQHAANHCFSCEKGKTLVIDRSKQHRNKHHLKMQCGMKILRGIETQHLLFCSPSPHVHFEAHPAGTQAFYCMGIQTCHLSAKGISCTTSTPTGPDHNSCIYFFFYKGHFAKKIQKHNLLKYELLLTWQQLLPCKYLSNSLTGPTDPFNLYQHQQCDSFSELHSRNLFCCASLSFHMPQPFKSCPATPTP